MDAKGGMHRIQAQQGCQLVEHADRYACDSAIAELPKRGESVSGSGRLNDDH